MKTNSQLIIFAKLFFTCKNLYLVNDEASAGSPKLGHTTLLRKCRWKFPEIVLGREILDPAAGLSAPSPPAYLYNTGSFTIGTLLVQVNIHISDVEPYQFDADPQDEKNTKLLKTFVISIFKNVILVSFVEFYASFPWFWLYESTSLIHIVSLYRKIKYIFRLICPLSITD